MQTNSLASKAIEQLGHFFVVYYALVALAAQPINLEPPSFLPESYNMQFQNQDLDC